MSSKETNRLKNIWSAVFILFSIAAAAPLLNERFDLLQPDGSHVPVIVSGDDYYQDVEGLNGYTLTRDKSTGWICYAALSGDSTEYLSTGIQYSPARPQKTPQKFEKHMRITRSSIFLKQKAAFFALHKISAETLARKMIDRPLRKTAAAADSVCGLTILIDFPDVKSAVPRDSIERFLNAAGYRGNGSVRDYYYDVSNGRMLYLNSLTAFITAKFNKSHYDRTGGYAGSDELLLETLTALKTAGTFDYKLLTIRNGDIVACDVLYAGSPSQGWAQGLWPHAGSTGFTLSTGVRVNRYMMANIGTSLTLGMICHENGHMLCGWPDLYTYDGHSAGAGSFCVMGLQNSTNPQQPNPFFRDLMGWITVTVITSDPLGRQYWHTANSPTAYKYAGMGTGGASESFYIEARRKTGRSAGLPGEGLLIWHVDTSGDNTTSGRRDLCMPEQADGLNELENDRNNGNTGDFFRSGYKINFNDATVPSSKWHTGTSSNIQLANVSVIADQMSFSRGNVVNSNPSASDNKLEVVKIRRQSAMVSIYIPFADESRISLIDLKGRETGSLTSRSKGWYSVPLVKQAGILVVTMRNMNTVYSKRLELAD